MLDPATEGRPALQALIARGLDARVSLAAIAPLSGGASSATFAIEASVGGNARRFIFQRTATADGHGLPRTVQAAVQQRAGMLGVPVPAVIATTTPPDNLGDGVITEFVEGEALAPRWLRKPEYAAARAALTGQCAAALARLHAAPLETWADLQLPGGSGASLLAQMFCHYSSLAVEIPAFDLAFAWLRSRMPATAPTCLVHGDFRSGNFLVTPATPGAGLAAVLDWELTHLSVPAEDLGWLCVQAWRFGQWRQPVGGFGTRAELLGAYIAHGGRIDPADLHLWEVFGTLKWGMSCLQLADDHMSGRVPSVERAAIGRRTSEVAADLVHLIAFGEL